MRRPVWPLLAATLMVAPGAVPRACAVELTTTAAIGAASYKQSLQEMAAGLANSPRRSLRDFGVQVELGFAGRYHVGLRAGVETDADPPVMSPSELVWWNAPAVADSLVPPGPPALTGLPGPSGAYWNPYISFERRSFGAGLGLVFTSGDRQVWARHSETSWSGHLRFALDFGAPYAAYLSIQHAESVPALSDGGVLQTGIGLRLKPWWQAWFGFALGNAAHEDDASIMLKSDFRVARGLEIPVRTRIGLPDSHEGFAASLGVRVQMAGASSGRAPAAP